MAVSLDRGDFSMLASPVTLEIEKRHEGEEGTSSYCQQLAAIWNRLLAVLVEGGQPGNGNLPEFREYARKRYSAELDEDVVTEEGR